MTSLTLLASCEKRSEIDNSNIVDSLIDSKEITADIESGFTLETIPKNWGRISIVESDTFKVVECYVLSQIRIYNDRPHSYFKIESFYIGTDSLLIKEFRRIAPDSYLFNLQSIKQDSSLIFRLKITDPKRLIGNWTIETGEGLGMTLANADKKLYEKTTYPCD